MAKKTKILTPTIHGLQWSISNHWNEAMISVPQRPLVKRDYCWASDLGKPYIDRYLKMHAIKPSTPPNVRSLRKFASGECWEWLVGFVLTMCGVLKQRQVRCEVELNGLLKVTGKCDFLAGGIVDWDKAKFEIKKMQDIFSMSVDAMPRVIMHAITHIVVNFENKYGNAPLIESLIENKAVSSFVSAKLEITKKPLPHHVFQGGHYLISDKTIPQLKIFNICKDDNILHEFDTSRTPKFLKEYKSDVEEMTYWYNQSNFSKPMKTMPPKEPEVLFDVDIFKFQKNFWVEWSDYLEMLYGYSTPEKYRMKWQRTINGWNQTFKRFATGANITPLNKQRMQEAKKHFPEWDTYVDKAIKSKIFEKQEENDNEEAE